MMARPLAIWDRIERREAAFAAGHQAGLQRLAELSGKPFSAKRTQVLCHREQRAGNDLGPHYDPMYEAGADYSAPRREARTELCVVLDDLRSQWNVGAVFRSAECLGWGQIRLCGITPIPPAPGLVRVSLGAESTVRWHYHAHIVACLRALAAEGYTLIALEQTADALALDDAPAPAKLALVLGNEVGGVSPEALAQCALRVAIPLAGRKASLNVAVAFGIAGHKFATSPEPNATAQNCPR